MKKYTKQFLDILNAHNIKEAEVKNIEDRDNAVLEINDKPTAYIDNKKAILITKNNYTKKLLVISNDVDIYE